MCDYDLISYRERRRSLNRRYNDTNPDGSIDWIAIVKGRANVFDLGAFPRSQLSDNLCGTGTPQQLDRLKSSWRTNECDEMP